ncbi:hypothetical protein CLW00_102209 [Mongoliibacter ruber]|uniref:Uncharacterized protein n=1 Tax=Mongoliibacter ruber TaxID=1750599 RepID=A0A2T0WSQ4_9BACT|nr:hypothetical protein CLW00_102209 [Mongoliibacter ruber]
MRLEHTDNPLIDLNNLLKFNLSSISLTYIQIGT